LYLCKDDARTMRSTLRERHTRRRLVKVQRVCVVLNLKEVALRTNLSFLFSKSIRPRLTKISLRKISSSQSSLHIPSITNDDIHQRITPYPGSERYFDSTRLMLAPDMLTEVWGGTIRSIVRRKRCIHGYVRHPTLGASCAGHLLSHLGISSRHGLWVGVGGCGICCAHRDA
jgi:hypothetical protein